MFKITLVREHHVYLRALLNTFPEWITNYTLQSASLGLLNKLIINTLMYERARPSAAALSLQVQNGDKSVQRKEKRSG